MDEAAASRARERWLRQQAGEEATLVGVLLDLAESGTGVIMAVSGRRHHGTITAVAEDFCALREARPTDHLVAYAAISGVEPREGMAPAGDRARALDMTLREALATLVAERPRVQVTDQFGDTRVGELASVGQDIVVLRPDGGARAVRHLYVPVSSIAEVAIAG